MIDSRPRQKANTGLQEDEIGMSTLYEGWRLACLFIPLCFVFLTFEMMYQYQLARMAQCFTVISSAGPFVQVTMDLYQLACFDIS